MLRAWRKLGTYRDDWSFREEEIDSEEGLIADPGVPSVGPPPRAEAFFAALDQDLDAPSALEILDLAEAHMDDPACAELVREGREILGLS